MQHLMRYPILMVALQHEIKKTNPSAKTETLIQSSLDKVESFAVHFEKAKEINDTLTSFDKGLGELKQQAHRLMEKDSVAGIEAAKLHAELLALRDDYANGKISLDSFKQESEKEIEAAQKTELSKHGGILDFLSNLLQKLTGKTIQPKPIKITSEMKASLQELKESAKPEPAADIENSDTESMSPS